VARVISRQGDLGGRAASPPLGCGLGTAFGMSCSDRWDRSVTAATIPQATIFAVLDSMRRHDAIHRAAGP